MEDNPMNGHMQRNAGSVLMGERHTALGGRAKHDNRCSAEGILIYTLKNGLQVTEPGRTGRGEKISGRGNSMGKAFLPYLEPVLGRERNLGLERHIGADHAWPVAST